MSNNRTAYHTDASFQELDGTFNVAAITEGEQGYIVHSNHASLEEAQQLAHRLNLAACLPLEDVQAIRLSSMTARI